MCLLLHRTHKCMYVFVIRQNTQLHVCVCYYTEHTIACICLLLHRTHNCMYMFVITQNTQLHVCVCYYTEHTIACMCLLLHRTHNCMYVFVITQNIQLHVYVCYYTEHTIACICLLLHRTHNCMYLFVITQNTQLHVCACYYVKALRTIQIDSSNTALHHKRNLATSHLNTQNTRFKHAFTQKVKKTEVKQRTLTTYLHIFVNAAAEDLDLVRHRCATQFSLFERLQVL
jgi:hypothetical protein